MNQLADSGTVFWNVCEQVARQAAQAKNVVCYANGAAIANVTEFKYLGHIISADQDYAAIAYNINKAMKVWCGMHHILCRDGADSPHMMAHFYLAVVQAKLLFGSEMGTF